jgi:CBS domain-containing protein
MFVRDVMTTEVVSVQPATPLKDVARLLVERRISGLPVVDETGAVLGVISEADFLAKESGPTEHHSRFGWLTGARREEAHDRQLVTARTAGEAMTSPAATIRADMPLWEAAREMAARRINRLPVVDAGKLVGIVTRADVVRTFARSDDEIRTAVEQAVRAVDGLRIEGVEDGVVRLGGTVAHPSIARAIPGLVAHVDGVVSVDASGLASMPEQAVAPTPESIGGSLPRAR